MNILLSTDNNYVMPTGVLMYSIGINNSSNIHYHVLINETVTEENKKYLQDTAIRFDNDIEFYTVKENLVQLLPFGKDAMPKHISNVSYFRLFSAQYLPDDVHKLIYLDGDMIVRKNLEPLWNTDVSDFAMACVHDMSEQLFIDSGRLKYPVREYGYFNAGMLLVNLDYWRNHDCLNRFIEYVENHGEDIIYHDQDLLNAVLYKEKKWVSTTYNFQVGFLQHGEKQYFIDDIFQELEMTMNDPAIIHYCTGEKPWQLYCYSPYVRVWRYYKSKSQWKGQRLEGDNPDSLIHHVTMFLFRHGLMAKKTGRLKKILNR